MVFTSALNGMGDTVTPTWLHIACLWLFEIPLAHGLAVPFELGIRGVFIAIALGMLALASSGAIAFGRTRWLPTGHGGRS
jgi:Na+-driven multidrug efflux pump